MQGFKRALMEMALVCVIIVSFCLICIEAYCKLECYSVNDAFYRKELAGQIDYLVLGASQTLTSFDPRIIDNELGCNSYNLGGSMATWYGRKYLLEEELERNPIKTVAIDISFSSMCRPSYDMEGDLYVFPRLSSVSKQLSYLTKCCNFSEYDELLSESVFRGSMAIIRFVSSFFNYSGAGTMTDIIHLAYTQTSVIDRSLKGFYPREMVDITLPDEDIISTMNSGKVDIEWNQQNVKVLEDIIRECKDRGIEVILVVTPVSDSILWSLEGWDDYRNELIVLSKNLGCELYDFNLAYDRYNLYNDRESFTDTEHLNELGAKVFTKYYCDFMSNGRDDSGWYESYEKLIRESPYAR